jgi:hypothetical protein
MTIHRDRLITALSLIRRDYKKEKNEWWWYTYGTFVKFSYDIDQPLTYRKFALDDEKLKTKYTEMQRHLRGIRDNLSTLTIMLHQANWQKKMAREGRLDDYYNDYYNMLYGTALADSFLTKYRSSYDTIAKAIIVIRRDPGHKPRESFTELHDICEEDYNKGVRILDEHLTKLIQSCDWYKPMLDARDGIVHENLQSSGFMHPRILFQIYKGFAKLINIPEVMLNENLADLELYAAVHIGYTFSLLEEFASLAYDILPVKKFSDSETAKSGYVGLGLVKDSIERVLDGRI